MSQPAPGPAHEARLGAPGLIGHVFLAADRAADRAAYRAAGRTADRAVDRAVGRHDGAHRCLHQVWDEVTGRLGLDQAVASLGAPSQLPPGAVPVDGFRLLAAAESSRPSVWQACAWADHGLLGLTAMMAPARDADCARTWPDLERTWEDAVAAVDLELLLAEARIFVALAPADVPEVADGPEVADVPEVADGPEVAGAPAVPALELARAAAPEPVTAGWWQHWDAVPLTAPGQDQALVWELGPDAADARVVRRMIAIAPAAAERQADRFLWTAGDARPSPLTRHLMHAARLRHQVRVFAGGTIPRQLRDELGAIVDDLPGHQGPDRDASAVSIAARLRQAHAAAIPLRRRLDTMRHAVGIVEENLRLALELPPPDAGPGPGPGPGAGPAGGPLDDDRRLATWFGQYLNDEITRLDAAIENAQAARGLLAHEEHHEEQTERKGHAERLPVNGDVSRAPLTAVPVAAPRRRPSRPRPRLALVFTALGVEYAAVRGYLGDEVRRHEEGGTVYEVGALPGARGSWLVALAEIGPGSTAAGIQLDRAVRAFEPEVALFLGVAGGRKDVARGDVVVADTIYDYEVGKSTLQGFQPRLRTHYPSYRLLQWARLVARENRWQRRLGPGCPDPPPASFVKPIVTGAKVIAHDRSDTARLLDRYAGDALAVETEGHGFLAAAYVNPKVDALVIRGISDLLTGKDQASDDYWQPVASQHAAAFAVELLDGIGASVPAR